MIRHKSLCQPGFLLLQGILLAAGIMIKPVQDRLDARLLQKAADPDLLYFGSPRVVKMLAFGYDGLLADVYWMRAIQYYGRRDEAERRPVRYKNLAALLDIATTLDPNMLDVYRGGSNFLGEADPVGAGQPKEALKLLDKGIDHFPNEWRLYFDKGFVYYWFMQDFSNASKTWLEGTQTAGAPPWMGSLAALGASRSGAIETARELWLRQYSESNRADVRENAKNHLNSIRVNEDLLALAFYLEKYVEINGRKAAVLQDLVRARLLTAVPNDPSDVPYDYDAISGIVALSPQSKVRLLKIPFDYKTPYRAKLESAYLARRKP
jgi:hypothetical protein